MVNQLETIYLAEVMHLLESARERADVLEPFTLHSFNGKAKHKLMEFLDGYLFILLLPISTTVALFVWILVSIQPKKANVI